MENTIENITTNVKKFDIKAFLLSFGISAILGFVACHFVGWWAIAPVCGLIAAWRNESVSTSFLAGLTAGLGLFVAYAVFLNTTNGGILATQVADLLGGKVNLGFTAITLTSTHVIQLTGIIGGLVGAMGAWTGVLVRRLFVA